MANVDFERNPLEVLAEEFADRQRRGEHPSMSEYTRRYPDLAEDIEQLFPTIMAMEQLKQRRLESGSGRASLGGAKLQWLGDYEIIREIGRGGMGIVYEAEQQSLGRRVAIKVLPRQATLESKQLMRFQREAQTAARLHHTNIVPVYGVGVQDGYHYYAMQFIRGLGLDLVIAELRRLELASGESTDCGLNQDSGGVSAAEAALAMLDGRFSVPRKPGSAPSNADPEPDSDSQPENTDALHDRGQFVGAQADSRCGDSPDAAPDGGRGTAPCDETEECPRITAPRQVPRGRTDDTPPGSLSATPPPSGVRALVNGSAAIPDDSAAQAYSSAAQAHGSAVRRMPSDENDIPNQNDGPDEDGAAPCPVTGSRVRGRRYWRSVARTGLQVADALQYAHAQGTLHRDIKPANLLLDGQGAVWVTDFGLARALEHDRVTGTGDIVGTLRYMAPEQIEGDADGRSDIYGLGLTLYELLTLRPAFEASNRNQLVHLVLQGEPARPRSICPDIPRDLETVVLKAIAREPEHRYESAEDLCEDLHRFLEDRTILARRPSPPERLWRWCRRNRAVAMLTMTAFAAILLAAVLGWVGYVRTARQHAQAQSARDLAEDNLERTLRAFDDISNRIAGQTAFQPIESDGDDENGENGGDEEGVWKEPPPEHVITAEDAAVLQIILDFYDQFAERNQGNVKLALETARANRRVGDIQRRLGNHAAAEEAYRKALDMYSSLAEMDDPPTTYALERAGIKNKLASVYSKRRQISQAAQELQEAERLLESLPDDQAKRPVVMMELVRTYNQVAMLRGSVSGMSRSEMRAKGKKALTLLEALRRQDPGNPEYRLATAQTMLHLANTSWFRDRSQQQADDPAEDPAEEAVKMLEQLVADHPGNPTYQFALAETYGHTARRRSMYRHPERAVERLESSVRILTDVTDHFGHIPDYKSSLVRAHMRLAMHLQRMAYYGRSRGLPDPETIENWESEIGGHLETAVALQSELAGEHASVPGYRTALRWCSLMLARHLLRKERFDDLRPLVARIIAAAQDRKSDPSANGLTEDRTTLGLEAEGLDILSKLQKHDGQEEQAEASAEQSRKIRERIAAISRSKNEGRGRSRRSSGRPASGSPAPGGPPRRGPPSHRHGGPGSGRPGSGRPGSGPQTAPESPRIPEVPTT